ncbi:MAG: hypothetical protein ACK4PR_13960, partial [Gammaproteobacteria bacterium]
ATIMNLRKAYKIIFRKNLLIEEVIDELNVLAQECEEVRFMIDGIQSSERGIARETRREITEDATEAAD